MTLNELVNAADDCMRNQQYKKALETYQEAWPLTSEVYSKKECVWLLLSIATAAVKSEEYEEAYDCIYSLFESFADTEIVVGNPYFHLMAGLTFAGLGDEDDNRIDNLARTLICGGPEMFNGENPALLSEMKEILRPPEELGTWEGYEGCSRDTMNDCSGYLKEIITKKIGAEPPYIYED